MNTKDEIADALGGQRTGAAPPAIFTQSGTVSQMDACGACWPEANFDAEKMAELAMQPAELFGFASARVPFDINIASEIVGCTIDKGRKDSQPAVTGSPWRTGDITIPEVPDIISPEEFLEGGRCPVIQDAARIIRSRREDLFLIAGMEDALFAASQMVGMETFLMGSLMDPGRCKCWVDALVPCMKAYAGALSEVADDVQIIVGASTDIMPPEMFHLLTEDSASKIIGSVRDSFSTVHCCGRTFEVMEDLASLGEDGLSVESFQDYETVIEKTCGKVSLIGGIPPVAHLMLKTPDAIIRDAWRSSDAGYSIIAPECGVPPYTPNENLLALARYREVRRPPASTAHELHVIRLPLGFDVLQHCGEVRPVA